VLTHPAPSPEPDKEISTIRLFRLDDLRERCPEPYLEARAWHREWSEKVSETPCADLVLPDALYLNNGATYSGNALRLGCERLGVTLIHAAPYDAPARGKMERFWRGLREDVLDWTGGITSLHDVAVRLSA
jgi:transposase InsO family protein